MASGEWQLWPYPRATRQQQLPHAIPYSILDQYITTGYNRCDGNSFYCYLAAALKRFGNKPKHNQPPGSQPPKPRDPHGRRPRGVLISQVVAFAHVFTLPMAAHFDSSLNPCQVLASTCPAWQTFHLVMSPVASCQLQVGSCVST